jgi:hypothetical protein
MLGELVLLPPRPDITLMTKVVQGLNVQLHFHHARTKAGRVGGALHT